MARDKFNPNRNVERKDLAIFTPKSFDDVENVITMLKDNKSVIVYVSSLKAEDSQRVLDILCGACFALNGELFEIEQGIVMCTPGNVNRIS